MSWNVMPAYSDYNYLIAGGAATAGVLAYWIYTRRRAENANSKRKFAHKGLPPGPEQAFLIGNLRNFPRHRMYEAFTEYQKQFGDIIQFNLMGTSIIILHNLDYAQQLFVKRQKNYSNRRHTVMMNDLLGLTWALPVQQPGPDFVETRKILRKAIGPQVISEYDSIIQKNASVLLKTLVERKDTSVSLEELFVKASGSVITTVSYGEEIYRQHGEELSRLNNEVASLINRVLSQVWFVNIFPWLRFIPSWFPGAEFRRLASRGYKAGVRMRFWVFELVEQAIENGTADLSIASKYYNSPNMTPRNLRDSVSVLYFAGTETTTAALLNFFSAVLVHPEVQRKIHEEIDRVVGHNREPTAAQVQNLRYLKAAWKESFRWSPTVPLGLPHVSQEDDVFEGHFIRNKSLVFCNIGFVFRDRRIWGEDADEFKPERFMPEFNPSASTLPDPGSIVFGFGRRICPGRYIAERTTLLFSAAILSACDMIPHDGDVVPEPRNLQYEDTAIRRPADFRCKFVSRQ